MSDQLQQLQAELQAVKARLAKTEASKQKLKESWALLKEKVINAHTLCDERDALLKQLDDESSARAAAQQRLQEALQQKAALDKQYGAAKKEKQRLDKLLDAAAAEKEQLGKRLAHAMTAADRAQQQHQAALKQHSAAQAAMEQQLNKLQFAVQQLEQQQVINRLSSLERHWKHLTDKEHVLTVDKQELRKAVAPTMHQLLQQQLEPRLSGIEQCLQQLQQQVQQQPINIASAAGEQQQLHQQQLAPQEELQNLQQLLKLVVTEQQQLRAEFATAQQQLALQRGSQVNPLISGAAQVMPIASPQHLTASPTATQAACRATECQHTEQPAGQPGSKATAAKDVGDGNDVQSNRGSSMFGTTVLNTWGSSSSYSLGGREGSSEPSVHQQQQHFAGRKQPKQEQHEEQQQQQPMAQRPGLVQSNSAGDSSRHTRCSVPRLSPASGLQQQQWRPARPARLAGSSDLCALSSSFSDGSECDDSSEQSPKRQKLAQHYKHYVTKQQKVEPSVQQQSASPVVDIQQHSKEPHVARSQPNRQSLSMHFEALNDQHSDAAALARQVASLVTSGKLHIEDLVKASCDSVFSAAAVQYNVRRLQQQPVAGLLGRQQHPQQDVELLGTVGWASEQYEPAKVVVYHQRLAAYIMCLSDLLVRQQQQAGVVGCSELQGAAATEQQQSCQRSLTWPAAAARWRQLLSEIQADDSCLDQQAASAAAAAAVHRSSAKAQTLAADSNLLQQVAQQLMQPVYQACCAAAAAAKAPLPHEHAQQQQQQQTPLARACAATAAAVRMLRVSDDRNGFHCIIMKLILAATQAIGWPSSSLQPCSSSTAGLHQGVDHADVVYCLACLLAAVGAWSEGLQLDADIFSFQPAERSVAASGAAAAAGHRELPDGSSNKDEVTWQLLVLDPVLVAINSCLSTLAQRAMAAGESVVSTGKLDAELQSPCALLGQALLAMLPLEAAAAASRRAGVTTDTMQQGRQPQVSGAGYFATTSSGPPLGVSSCQADGLSTQLEPAALLASLLGVLELLLRKQHPALPGCGLVASGAAWALCIAGYCISIRLLATVAAAEKLAALMEEFHSVLSDASVHAYAEAAHVQQYLAPLLPPLH